MRTLPLVAAACLVGVGCGRPPAPRAVPAPTPADAGPAPPLAVATMQEAFHRDPAKAQVEYAGRRFRVRFQFDQTGDGGVLCGAVTTPGDPLGVGAAVFLRAGEAAALTHGQVVLIEAEFREFSPGELLPLWLSDGAVVR
jgi:hypothetical protein